MTRLFTSFDFEYDDDLRTMLVGQSRHPDTPFEIADWSLKESLPGDWKAKVRERIRRVEQVVVICGQYTHVATGVAAELDMARAEGKPYFLLWGRPEKTCVKPSTAAATDKIYRWTWENLRALLAGSR
jgi:hypothetical protein